MVAFLNNDYLEPPTKVAIFSKGFPTVLKMTGSEDSINNLKHSIGKCIEKSVENKDGHFIYLKKRSIKKLRSVINQMKTDMMDTSPTQ
jgi:hypothetical protein